jgi:MFS family permease
MAFVIVALSFLLMVSFSTIPTPLYPLYQERDQFPTSILTVVFAVYAIGVATSLYFVGHLSDAVGRRTMLRVAVLAEIGSILLFLLCPTTAGLVAARIVAGIGVGIVTPTATAYIRDLNAHCSPASSPSSATTISTLMNMGGFALGPLLGGLFAQYVPMPLMVPYLLFLAGLVIVGLLSFWLPETVQTDGEYHYSPQRVKIPEGARPRFAAAAFGAAVSFAINGLMMALTPTVLGTIMGWHAPIAAGLIPFLVFGAGAVVPAGLAAETRQSTQLVVALLAVPVGLSVFCAAVVMPNISVFIFGELSSGIAAGILFRVSVGTVAQVTPRSHRGEALAALFLSAYFGLAVPVLAVGFALQYFSLSAVLVGFSVLVSIVGMTAITLLLCSRHRSPIAEPVTNEQPSHNTLIGQERNTT